MEGKPTSADLLLMYRQMLYTRILEQKMADWNSQGTLMEAIYSCAGQEAIGVGSCFALQKQDLVLPSLRTRSAYISRGVLAEDILRIQALRQGSENNSKIASSHTPFPEYGILPGTGMVGSSISIGVGAALAARLQKSGQVVLIYFGDGACSRGDFHEAINFAAVRRLPCVFIIENNQAGQTALPEEYLNSSELYRFAQAYDIPGFRLDGNDVEEVYLYASRAAARARQGQGPTILDCLTMRMGRHSSNAVFINAELYLEDVLGDWRKKDPILRLQQTLIRGHDLDKSVLSDIYQECEVEIEQAYERVLASPQLSTQDVIG